jgi:hypothetical protein
MRYSKGLKEIINHNKEVSSLTKHYSDYEILGAIHTVIDWSGDFHSCFYESLSIQGRTKDFSYEYIYVIDVDKKRIEVEVVFNNIKEHCTKCLFEILNSINEELAYGKCYVTENEVVYNITENYFGIISYEDISKASQDIYDKVIESVKKILGSVNKQQPSF